MISIWLTFLFNMVGACILSWGLYIALVLALYGIYKVMNRRNPEPGTTTGAGVELDLERQEDMFGFAELKRRGSGRR